MQKEISQKVQIEVNSDGTISVDLIGYHGPACDQVMKQIEAVFGSEVVQSHKKEEYFEDEPKVTMRQKQRLG